MFDDTVAEHEAFSKWDDPASRTQIVETMPKWFKLQPTIQHPIWYDIFLDIWWYIYIYIYI